MQPEKRTFVDPQQILAGSINPCSRHTTAVIQTENNVLGFSHGINGSTPCFTLDALGKIGNLHWIACLDAVILIQCGDTIHNNSVDNVLWR